MFSLYSILSDIIKNIYSDILPYRNISKSMSVALFGLAFFMDIGYWTYIVKYMKKRHSKRKLCGKRKNFVDELSDKKQNYVAKKTNCLPRDLFEWIYRCVSTLFSFA